MTGKTYVQIMQDEIDALKADREKMGECYKDIAHFYEKGRDFWQMRARAAELQVRGLIKAARESSPCELAQVVDDAETWLFYDNVFADDDPAAFGPEVAACSHARRWNLEDDGSLTCCECGASVTLLDLTWLVDEGTALGWAGAGAEEGLKVANYRIHWISSLTGQQGHGSRSFPYGQARQMADEMNNAHPKLHHFVLADNDPEEEASDPEALAQMREAGR